MTSNGVSPCSSKCSCSCESADSLPTTATTAPPPPVERHPRHQKFQPTTAANSKAASFHLNIALPGWIDALEKEFDSAFVSLDLMLGDLDSDQCDLLYECRQKLTAISSVFAQFIHKTQSLSRAKRQLEEELCIYKDQFTTSIAMQAALEEETQSLMLQVHRLQCLQLPTKAIAPHESDRIMKRLEEEMGKQRCEFTSNAKLQAQVDLLGEENGRLRAICHAMQTEVYGARLAAKYLDKVGVGRGVVGRVKFGTCRLLGRRSPCALVSL